jgi:predicted Zn-dependent peptidase
MGRPVLGPEENVRNFDHDMIADYMSRHYHANALTVVAVGNVDHEEFVRQAAERFGDVAPGDKITAVPSRYVGGQTVAADDRYDQAHLFVAFPAPGIASDEFAVYDLLSDVLGGGMSSPLFQRVREERGLCYSVGAGMSPQPDASLFVLNGATTAENVDEFIVTACAEIAKIAKGEIGEDDWTRAMNQTIRQIVSRSEKPTALASQIVADMLTIGKVRTISEQVARYSRVTREDVIAAAQSLLTLTPTVIVAGNAAEKDYAALVAEGLNG